MIFSDFLDFEATRDDMERKGLIDTFIIGTTIDRGWRNEKRTNIYFRYMKWTRIDK